MNDFLQDDFFYAKPILNIEGLGKEDVITDLLSIEEFHGRDIFLDNPISSEFVIIEGATSAILEEGNSTYNVVAAETVEMQLTGGSHNIVQISGAMDYEQVNGDAVIYLADLANIDLNIQISNGSLSLIVDDLSTTGEITITDGNVYFGNVRSNIEFADFDEASTSISIANLVDGNTFEISNNFNPSLAESTNSGSFEDSSTSDSLDNSISEDNSGTFFDENFTSFDDLLESYFGSGSDNNFDIAAYEEYSSLASGSLALDFYSDMEASHFFYQDFYIELTKSSSANADGVDPLLFTNSSTKDSPQLEIDTVIEINTYADLAWDNALEIFEDF